MARNIQDLPEKSTLVSSDEIIGLDSLSSDRGSRWTLGTLSTFFRTSLQGLATVFGRNAGEVAPEAEGDNTDTYPISKIPVQPASKITGIDAIVDGRLNTTVVRTSGNQTIADIKNFTGTNPLLVNGSPVISLTDLEVEQVPSIPMNFDVIAGLLNFSSGGISGSITLDVAFGPDLLIIPASQIVTATVTNLERSIVTNINSAGLVRIIYQSLGDRTAISFEYDTSANRALALQNFVQNFSDQYHLEVTQVIVNEEGAYAQVNDELFVPQGATIRGGTSLHSMTATDCIDLRTRSRQVYQRFQVGNVVTSLSSNMQVNGSFGFATIGGAAFVALPEGTYVYLSGFEHAGIFRKTTAFGAPAIGWGELLGVQYGDQFTNGVLETIPSGTNVRLAGDPTNFRLVNTDSELLAAFQADNAMILHNDFRTPNLPTTDPQITGAQWRHNNNIVISGFDTTSNDLRTGTWVPVPDNADFAAFENITAQWTKRGNRVFAWAEFDIPSTSTDTSAIQMTGLPFVEASRGSIGGTANNGRSSGFIVDRNTNAGDFKLLRANNTGGGGSGYDDQAGNTIRVQIEYQTNA